MRLSAPPLSPRGIVCKGAASDVHVACRFRGPPRQLPSTLHARCAAPLAVGNPSAWLNAVPTLKATQNAALTPSNVVFRKTTVLPEKLSTVATPSKPRKLESATSRLALLTASNGAPAPAHGEGDTCMPNRLQQKAAALGRTFAVLWLREKQKTSAVEEVFPKEHQAHKSETAQSSGSGVSRRAVLRNHWRATLASTIGKHHWRACTASRRRLPGMHSSALAKKKSSLRNCLRDSEQGSLTGERVCVLLQ